MARVARAIPASGRDPRTRRKCEVTVTSAAHAHGADRSRDHAPGAPAGSRACGRRAHHSRRRRLDRHQVRERPGLCGGTGFAGSYFDRLDCGVGRVKVSGASPTSTVRVLSIAEDGTVVDTEPASFSATTGAWQWNVAPGRGVDARPDHAPRHRRRRRRDGRRRALLPAARREHRARPAAGGYRPGDPIPLGGHLYEQDDFGADTSKKDVAGRYFLRVRHGERRGARPVRPLHGEPRRRGPDPRDAARERHGRPDRDQGDELRRPPSGSRSSTRRTADPVTGAWKASSGKRRLRDSFGPAEPARAREQLRLGGRLGEARRDLSVPRLRQELHCDRRTGAVVTIPGRRRRRRSRRRPPSPGSGTASIAARAGRSPGPSAAVPRPDRRRPRPADARRRGARPTRSAQDPQIVWKNLSSTATPHVHGRPRPTSDEPRARR